MQIQGIMLILIILGTVQGVAEFLPISSSGHLVILESLPFFADSLKQYGLSGNLFVNVALHVASLVAIILFLWKDIVSITTGSIRGIVSGDFKRPEVRTALYIIVASIPAGLVGIFFNDELEQIFSSPKLVFIMLIINGFVLIFTKKIRIKDRQLEEIGLGKSIIIGFFQALAIMPGISRSGMTIAGGLFNGLRPIDSARFSFLMAVPVIAGAGLLEGMKAMKEPVTQTILVPLAISMVITIAVSIVSLKILFALVKRIRIDIFGYYTLFLGTAGLIILYLL